MKSIAAILIVMMSWTCCLAAETDSETDPVAKIAPVQTYKTFDNMSSLYQPYLANIGPYKPVYFLYGVDPKYSRFQISLKYQLLGDECPIHVSCEWMRGIHLGYTQTSSWNLSSDSSPFEDTSYQPEIFFLTDNLSARPGWLDGLFLQAGVQHESNGRADVDSRSTNYMYLTPSGILYNESNGLGIQVSPKLVWFFNSSSDNPDIESYRGKLGLGLKAGWAESLVLDANFRFASEGVSTQLDLTYPLSAGFLKNFEFYLHVQYANSLAETLIHYKERTEALRIGIALVRLRGGDGGAGQV